MSFTAVVQAGTVVPTVPWYRGMQDGGDAFQGASAAAVLEAIALVLAPTFPEHRRRARFSIWSTTGTRPPLGGFWLARPAPGCATGE